MEKASDTIFGYRFRNPALLQEALTTPSFRMSTPGAKDNQRLEFLGDAVIGLLAADRVYAQDSEAGEGSLTVRRAGMVSTSALCEAAGRLELAPRLRRNKGAAELPCNSKTLADAIEAIMGAVWLDGGIEAARTVFDALELGTEAKGCEASSNPKGDLQIRAQAMTPPRHPEYILLKTAGSAHMPLFTVRVEVDTVGSAEATAGALKEAEACAAAKLLASWPL